MSTRPVTTALFAAWITLTATLADASVSAPRVVSEHNADAYSMKTFADYPAWRDLQGDAKAWEMFKYLTDLRTGLYPMGVGAREGTEQLYEYSQVRDPVKMINVYSMGFCDVFGPVMAGIWQDAGLGQSRVVDLPGWSHVVSEVNYNNDWHYLDLDVRAAFRRNDGSLAKLEASKYESSLWDRTNGPRFFPLDNLANVRQAYEQTALLNRYGVHQSGHTMDFSLRQGETFIRWWEPQGGRWLHHPSYENDSFIKQLLEAEPRGPKSKHSSFTTHTHGNGRFIYQPDLSQSSTDFSDGVYDSQNITTGPNGLTLNESGSGYAVFEIRTPYVIVPLVGNTATTSDDSDASVIEVSATNANYSISLDNGITWESVLQSGSAIDLTSQVAGKYSYLFKIELDGNPGQALVSSLKMTTWVQLAPASLPSLRSGTNNLEFITGDHYGLPTRVMEIQPNTSIESDLLKHIVVAPTQYNPQSVTSRIQGPFVMAVVPPPSTKIAWFSAGGSFETYQLAYASNTNFTMAYAPEVPFAFNEFYSANIPQDMTHWHTNAQADVQLTEPASALYLRYEGQPAVNNIRIYAHVIDDNPTPQSPVRITHTWRENGQVKTFNTSTDNGSGYSIDVAGTAENVSIEMSVDSRYEEVTDSVPPVVLLDFPASNSTILPDASVTIQGTATDDASGVQLVRIRVIRRGVSPYQYWNGSSWQSSSAGTLLTATLSGESWILPDVDLSQQGAYRIRLKGNDNAGNRAASAQSKFDFNVVNNDTTNPTGTITNPANNSTVNPDTSFTIQGTASDESSGVHVVRARVERRDVSPVEYWNGTSWQTTARGMYKPVILNGNSWTHSNIDLSQTGDYRVRLYVRDLAGNRISPIPSTNFSVVNP